MSSAAGAWRARSIALLLAVLAAGAFLPSLGGGFLFDDDVLILGNAAVTGGVSPAGVRWAFGTFLGGNWIPLTWLSHQADVLAWGLHPAGHHLTSVLLHALNVAILFLVVRRLTGSLGASALLAALFGAHPLRVESVAWVSERKDVLSTAFLLLGLGAWGRYARAPGRGRLAAVAAALAGGLMAKPMLVTFPFVLLVLDWWPLGRWRDLRRRLGARGAAVRLIVEKAPLFALAAVAGVLAVLAQRSAGTTMPLRGVTLGARLGNAIVSYARYLADTAWPAGLSPIYLHPGGAPPAWQWAAALALLGAITAAVVRCARRQPWLAAGWLWYLGTLVPVIGVVQVGVQALADRYTYLPSVGLALMPVWTGAALLRSRPGWRSLGAAAGAAAVALLGVATWGQSRVWRDGVTLFAHAVRVEPANWMARNNLGKYLREQGRWGEAEAEIRESLRLNPANADAHYNLAVILESTGRGPEAAAAYRETLRLAPGYAAARAALGGVLLRGGDPAAEGFLAEAVRLLPRDAAARVNLGIARERRGDLEAALRLYREAAGLDPLSSEAVARAGGALVSLGRLDEAVPWLDLAVQMRPRDVRAHVARATALERLGRMPEAAYSLRRALALAPGDDGARRALERLVGAPGGP